MSVFGAASGSSSSPMVPSSWNANRFASVGTPSQQQQQSPGQGSMMQRSSPSTSAPQQQSQQQQQGVERQASFTFGGSMPQPFRSFQQQAEPASPQQQQHAFPQQQQGSFAPFQQQQQQQPYGFAGAPGMSSPQQQQQQQTQQQPGMFSYGQPSQQQSFGTQGMPRSSSFRMPRRSDGTSGVASASPMQAFNLGGMDPQTSFSSSPQQSKTVRWHDAPQQATEQASIYPNLQNNQTFHAASSSLPQQTQQNQHQQQQQQSQQAPSGYSQYSVPSQQAMQTPSRPQPSQNMWSTPASQTQSQQPSVSTPKSAFSSSLASIAKPVTTLTSAHKPQQSTPSSQGNARTSASSIAATVAAAAAASASRVAGTAQGAKGTAPTPAPAPTTSTDAVITPRPAIVARLKWNAIAIFAAWLLPRLGPMSALYWTLLDVTYKITNGALDLQLAAALSWSRTAIFLVCFVNMAEATIRLQTYSSSSAAASTPASGTAGTAGKRKPSLQHPPSRSVSSSQSPAPASPNNAATSRRSMPRQYAQDSPLRDSILRASVSSQQEYAARAATPSLLGTGRRLPSETPRFDGLRTASASARKPSSSATPLAAYLARKQERIASGKDFGDLSFEGSGADSSIGDISSFSTDSIAIDRALRALSEDYGREMSHSRSSASPSVAA